MKTWTKVIVSFSTAAMIGKLISDVNPITNRPRPISDPKNCFKLEVIECFDFEKIYLRKGSLQIGSGNAISVDSMRLKNDHCGNCQRGVLK